jgi:DNA replication protein DnaC
MHQLESNPRHIRLITDEERDRLLIRHPDLPRSIEDCITCRGEKSFRWYADEEIVDYECDCFGQYVLCLWLLAAGVDMHYQRLARRDVMGVPLDAMERVNAYQEEAEDYAQMGMGLVLRGIRGGGKTMLATLLLKQLLADGMDGYFTTFERLLSLHTKGWRDDEAAVWFERRVCSAGILVVDDMGRENEGRSAVSESAWDHVLRTRVAAQRPTIVTTNKTMEEMQAIYSPNSISLLSGCSEVIDFLGEDFRPRHFERTRFERKSGLRRPVVLR